MRILVAQMTRMGDMLQTSSLTRALRMRYPDARITAMVRPMARGIAERNPDINDVIPYEEDSMFLDLRSGDSERLLRAYRTAEALVKDLNARKFDVIYNCTHSIASAMLFKMVRAGESVGAHLSDDWQFLLRGRWTNYFFTSVYQRVYSDINISDVFRNLMNDAPPVAGLNLAVTDDDRREARDILAQHGIGQDESLVCVQLGASDEPKRWPAAHFAELARRLVNDRHARICLLGVEAEAPLGEAFERHAPGIAAHLFGKTTIHQVAAILERARLLVTNDTGTMHIAAAVGCPILLLSVGYVHFRETGPYGEGHVAVEQRKDYLAPMDRADAAREDRGAIQPAQVSGLLDLVLATDRGKALQMLAATSDWTGLEVFQSRFAPDGFLEWYPLIRRPMTEIDLIRMAYRNTWLAHLCPAVAADTLLESIQQAATCFDASNLETVDSWRSHWDGVFLQLEQLAVKGIKKTRELEACLRKGKSITVAKEIVGELMRLDEDTRLFAELHEGCRPLITIARFQRDNLEGADPMQLAETTLGIYRDLSERAALMRFHLSAIHRALHALAARK
ncbi:MAG TPA: glycosyltransferase family 9 protein [Candidatus Hydrogenedentes bacterium]|nr:glycosyltransferase family 9 protein [Candidatus Hydrogenedentota bacterium]